MHILEMGGHGIKAGKTRGIGVEGAHVLMSSTKSRRSGEWHYKTVA